MKKLKMNYQNIATMTPTGKCRYLTNKEKKLLKGLLPEGVKMKKYIVEEHSNKTYHLYEVGDNSKRLIGKFDRKDEANFHMSIRNNQMAGKQPTQEIEF